LRRRRGTNDQNGSGQFILPSGGTWVYASTQDHELLFAIPKIKIDLMMKALADTHAVGFRYPYPDGCASPSEPAAFSEIPPKA
jgi:hypothetical protein